MKYTYSEHYRKDPFQEVDAARFKNSLDSVQATLEARLDSEVRRVPQDTEAVERIQSQLAYLGSVALQDVKVA